MAIQKEITNWDQTGNYIRVGTIRNLEIVNGDERIKPFKSQILVEVWESAEKRELAKIGRPSNPQFVRGFNCDKILASVDEAYLFIKSLPEFANAEDI